MDVQADLSRLARAYCCPGSLLRLQLVRFESLTCFIVNKQAFYQDGETFSDTHREYAVRLMTATLFPDKQDLWSASFERWRLSDA